MRKHSKAMLILGSGVLLGLAIAAVFLLARDDNSKLKDVTLAHDKGNLPLFNENFKKQGEFAKMKIGIGINPIASKTSDLFVHQMRASLPTEQAPDLFVWWSTFRVRELVEKNLVGDLTDLWNKHGESYPKGLRDAFTVDGKQYGFPYAVEYWPVWYNKKVFERLGLQKPRTWVDFIEICETLQAAGITPILSSLQDRWPAFIWFEEMIIGEDPDLYEGLCLGKVKYTDPRVKKAFGVWRDLIKKRYFTDPSANMLTNAGYLWNNEKFGMVLAGTWYYSAVLLAQGVDKNDIGAFILPSHNSNAGNNIIFEAQPIFAAKNAANAESARKIVDWWMGSEGNGHFTTLHQTYPSNIKTDTAYLPPVKENLIHTIKKDNYRVLNRYWEATPVKICTAAVDKFAEFILNPDELDTILGDIEEIAADFWSQNLKR